jgi:hypothetical protein
MMKIVMMISIIMTSVIMMGMRMTVSETSSQKHPRQQTSNGKEKRILTAISFSMSFRLVLVLMERNKRKKKKI